MKKLVALISILFLLYATNLFSITREELGWHVGEYIKARDVLDLTKLVSIAGDLERTVEIADEMTLSGNTTVPSTMHLYLLKGGYVTLGSYDLTINGPLTAPIAQIFDDSGSGSVSFGSGYVKEVYPQWWGGIPDGSTDNAGAIQSAHDALPADGGIIFLPSTSTYYKISSQTDFTKPVVLKGADWYCSDLTTDTNALVMFTTIHKLVVENINFVALSAAIGTATAIKTLSTATNHGGTTLRNCYFSNFTKAYWSQRSNHFAVDFCKIGIPANGYGLYLENTTSSDEGDSFVSNSTIAGTSGGAGIYVTSTSGLYISNNKFNSPTGIHIDIAPTTNNVGNFLINNCSFEGHTTAAIRLIATTGSITKTIISGNQFSSGSATHIVVGKYAKNTNISGNVFNDSNAANGVGIDIQNDSLNTTIKGNAFHQILTAINSSANITGQLIADNRFASDVTNYYLAGELDDNLNGPGSEKDFEMDRYISNSSNADYVNAFQLKGECILEVFVTGIVQGDGHASKYRKVVIYNDTTITDLIAEVASGSTFDLQIAASGGYTVVGIKRNGATGTSVTMQVRVKVSGFIRDFSKV